MELFWQILAVAGLVFGFGFVVFFHELGHFLAAKAVGIKVEQFAVGFGQALLAWRKGIGMRVGTTTPEYERRLKENASNPAYASTLGETEYRLNWIPLGGYVKMLGQDDMNPNAAADDPRAFNQKSIAARMLVVSAGVIMNVILAVILFVGLFLYGYNVAPATVGEMLTNSPAQLAGFQVGDKIVSFNGQPQPQWTSFQLSVALVPPDAQIPVTVDRKGQMVDLWVQPERHGDDRMKFFGIGISPIFQLRGADSTKISREKLQEELGRTLDSQKEILPGDEIIKVEGTDVDPATGYAVFDQKVQESGGRPVRLTVRDNAKNERQVNAEVGLSGVFFGGASFNLAGMQPRVSIAGTEKAASVHGKLLRDDVICAIKVNGEEKQTPSLEEFVREARAAGEKQAKMDFLVLRKGQMAPEWVDGVVPDFRRSKLGRLLGIGSGILGVAPTLDEAHPVVADVMDNSAAKQAYIPRGSLIQKVNGNVVSNWMDVREELKKSGGKAILTIAKLNNKTGQPESEATNVTLMLSKQEQKTIQNVRYDTKLLLREHTITRQTDNPMTALRMGVEETRDLLLQFYVTLRRLVQGTVSASNLMGPVGIMYAGSMFAFKGGDWLIWFLAMISANLAVVNFLPIPIVDGGLFTFLILEKITGKPLSPRMQAAAQIIGLAIILSVFVFVTFQDIRNFIF